MSDEVRMEWWSNYGLRNDAWWQWSLKIDDIVAMYDDEWLINNIKNIKNAKNNLM